MATATAHFAVTPTTKLFSSNNNCNNGINANNNKRLANNNIRSNYSIDSTVTPAAATTIGVRHCELPTTNNNKKETLKLLLLNNNNNNDNKCDPHHNNTSNNNYWNPGRHRVMLMDENSGENASAPPTPTPPPSVDTASAAATTTATKFNESPFEQHYDVGEQLGSGQFATVRRVVKRSTNERFAAKFIRKRRYATSRRGVPRLHIQREVDVLRVVGGRANVIQLHDVFETSNEVILVLELVCGGELFDHVCAKECLDEAEASAFVRQILLGVRHLHTNHVVHLDIKPENIMLMERGRPLIKLVDFGLSRQILPGIPVKDMIGTPEFVAPEIVNYEPLSTATDMWSLGIVTYILLSGGSPFLGRTREETFCNISGVNYHFPTAYFGRTSDDAKDFIVRLLVRDPRRRPTAEECLDHPWIRKHQCPIDGVEESPQRPLSIDIHSYRIRNRWKKAIGIVRFCVRIIRQALIYSIVVEETEQQPASTVDAKPNECGSARIIIDDADDEASDADDDCRCNAGDDEDRRKLWRRKLPRATPRPPTVFSAQLMLRNMASTSTNSNQSPMSDPNNNEDECCSSATKDNVLANAVFVACEDGDLKALERLGTEYGINAAFVVNDLGETPLHVASGAGFDRIVNFLLRRGADARHADKSGDTPLFWAARNGHAALIRMLTSAPSNPTATQAARNIPPASTRLCDINVRNKAGETALHVATRYSQLGCAVALLEHGVDPNVQDEHGETASHIASWHGYALLLGVLCRFDPRLDLLNRDDETALHCASTRGHIECVQNLVENGAPIDAQDHCGQTALHLALKRSHVDVALFLITKGCNLDLQDEEGDTALHIASRLGLVTIVQTLCHLGAKLDVQNAQSLTPLHIAAKECHAEVVRCLCLAGCSYNIKTKDGLTAEIISFAHKNSEIGSLLAKMKSTQARDDYAAQLCPLVTPLRRIKLKLFGHSNVGKTALYEALQRRQLAAPVATAQPPNGSAIPGGQYQKSGGSHNNASMRPLNSIMDAVTRRLSDNLLLSSVHGGFGGSSTTTATSSTNATAATTSAQTNGNACSQSHPAISNRRNVVTSMLDSSGRSGSASTPRTSSGSAATVLEEDATTTIGAATSTASCSAASSASSTDSGVIADYGGDASRRRPTSGGTTTRSGGGGSVNGGGSGGGISLPINYQQPTHTDYTRGIDVRNVNFPGCGEFSVWEFGGYEPYHIAYDHFVGNTDCIHIVVIRATDPTEVQYKQVLYWMNFLKGRITPSEPIGHCGIVSRRSKVIVVGTHATREVFGGAACGGGGMDEPFTSTDADAMMKTVKLRFETHFDIYERLLFVDANNGACAGMRSLRNYLQTARDSIVERLQRPLPLLDICVAFLSQLRKRYANFPVITWPHFTNVVRHEINPLATDAHCRQLVQQLQLVGEVVYLRDETSELDYVVLTPDWLGVHVIGRLLSAQFLERCAPHGCYTAADLTIVYPEIAEPADLLRILDTLQLCAIVDDASSSGGGAGMEVASAVDAASGVFEFPAFIGAEPPTDLWMPIASPNNASSTESAYVYGGMRLAPQRGMEKSLQSTFPRIQVAMRRSMRDFHDPMDAELHQWRCCSKMCSGQMQALVRLHVDTVEVQVRGPPEMAASCVYFLEDIASLVEQTAGEVAPGICIERHFLSPCHLRAHRPTPASFAPEVLMAMQQCESLRIRNSDGEEELFTDVVCFGSRETAATLTLGVDVSVSQLQLASRCELAALLDPPDAMGRDWSILAVKLNLADQLPEVDSTGQSLSRTDQLLAEWALQCPEAASIGRLCSILEELGREDARDVLYRTMPLYLFAPLDEQQSQQTTGAGGGD